MNQHTHDRVQLHFPEGEGRTKQSFKDECDVNQIMKRWQKTGEMNHLNNFSPTYGDFTNADDYLSATLKCKQAESDFDALSANIRNRMGNNPANLLAFMADPANLEEAVSLGLVQKPADPPAPPAAPAPAPANPPAQPASPVSGGE